jgi:UDP-GlcNAc:undecaprenyl-phosphate GlcNAc-1-phosphate transferase
MGWESLRLRKLIRSYLWITVGSVVIALALDIFLVPNKIAAGDLVLLVLFLVGVVFFALLGLLDDLLGSRENRGLKGHFGALLNGKLTTGALKALGGGAGALLISFISLPGRPWWEILTAALLMALAANTINLVDLRPGRAIKVFYLWFLILLAVFQDKLPLVLIAPLAGGLLACAPADLKARAMLGDTGANLLR